MRSHSNNIRAVWAVWRSWSRGVMRGLRRMKENRLRVIVTEPDGSGDGDAERVRATLT